MKKIGIFFTVIFALSSWQVAALNRIRIETDFIDYRMCDYIIEVEVINDELLGDFLIALEMEYTNFTGDIENILAIPGSRADGAMNWSFEIRNHSGSGKDTAIIMGTAMPPDHPGLMPGPAQSMFCIDIQTEESPPVGIVHIDSCSSIDPYGNWSWGEINPSFSYTEIIIDIIPGGLIVWLNTPENDQLIGDHCEGASFQFLARNGLYPEEVATGYKICHFDYTPQIDNDGLFSYPPGEPGIYPVEIQAVHWGYGTYSFDVVLTNSPMSFTDVPQFELYRAPGEVFQVDLGLSGMDCDPLTETVNIIAAPRQEPMLQPTCANGVFEWQPGTEDLGSWTFEVVSSDPYDAEASCQFDVTVTENPGLCGDANSDGNVNVSDAVHIINYIFIGGDPPDPMDNGNVNCDGSVNISDAVWIINYVFIGGAEPCDC
ncbi:MAG: hypothetical protein GF310_14145 [candidate division Zixibacteria bacterium]|nr:hypothetical protein [candidate division Zixibacteria bacterium]